MSRDLRPRHWQPALELLAGARRSGLSPSTLAELCDLASAHGTDPARYALALLESLADQELGPRALEWAATLATTPWTLCHRCGELTTALDHPPLNTPCACWDDADRDGPT